MKTRHTGNTPVTPERVRPDELRVMRQAPKMRSRARAPAGANSTTGISPEEFQQMVASAAYFRAEKRGFTAGHELEDWLEAETEIRRQLGQAVS